MSESISCASCTTTNPLGNKFCRSCGASMKGAAWTPPADEAGFVAGGMWDRPATEFMRRVSVEAMKRETGRMKIQVPAGSVAVVVREGQIDSILPPGKQVAVDWLDRLVNLFTDKIEKSEFYLIDVRPMPFSFPAEGRSQDGTRLHKYHIVVQLGVPRSKEGLTPFLEHFGGHESVSQQTVYQQLRPQIESLVRPFKESMGSGTVDVGALEQTMASQLKAGLAGRMGFEVGVAVLQGSSHVSIDVHIDVAPAPVRKLCVDAACGKEMESSKKFCPACGVQQPVMTMPTAGCGACGREVPPGKKFCTGCGAPFQQQPRAAEATALYSKDGQQLEVDIVMRAEGDSVRDLDQRAKEAVALATSKQVARFEFAQLATASGFKELEEALLPDLRSAMKSLGLEITEVTVLDLRSKGAQWLLKARSEMEHAKNGLLVGREWLAIEEQNLDLKVLSNDLALRNQRADRDQKFHLLKDELSDERRTAAARRDHVTDLREDELADRRRQQGSADEEASLDVRDAQRDATRDVAVDAAGRVRDRAIRAEEHRDTLDESSRQREAERQDRRFDREDQRTEFEHESDMTRRQSAFRREDEGAQADHELAMERKVAEHDADLSRQAMRLGSERTRLETDDRSYGARAGVDDDVYRTQKMGDVEDDLERKKLDRTFDDEKRREQLKLEKMKQLLELDELTRKSERDHAVLTQQMKDQQDARMQQMQQDHAAAMRAKLAGVSAEQALVMQLTDLGNSAQGAAVVQAFAGVRQSDTDTAVAAAKAQAERDAALVASQQQGAMFEKMLAMQGGASAAAQQQMMQMMQMMQQQAAQQMAVLGNVATAASGGQRESNAAREAAIQSGANQAVGIAQQAMGNMAQVATAGAATGGGVPGFAMPGGYPNAPQAPVAAAPYGAPAPGGATGTRDAGVAAPAGACAACNSPMQPDDKVCGECGTRR